MGFFNERTLERRIDALQADLEGILDRVERITQRLEELPTSSPLEELERELDKHKEAVSADLATLTTAVARGIEHTDRSEKRVRATVGRARRELQDHGLEHPGLEAEYQELQVIDGGAGQEEGVPDVPEDLDLDGFDTTGIPGNW